MNYFKMICEGVFLNKDLVSLLKTEQAKARENGVEHNEFFTNCEETYHQLQEELKNQIEKEKQIHLLLLKHLPNDIALDELQIRLNSTLDFIHNCKNDNAYIPEVFFSKLSVNGKMYAHQIQKIRESIIYVKRK